jgi:tetratricopeptide (TPR) repeat protein
MSSDSPSSLASNPSKNLRQPYARDPRWTVLFAGVLVVLSALAVYHNSFRGVFIFDDWRLIVGNSTLDHFKDALLPPRSSAWAGYPVSSFSFAVNFALGADAVLGYHGVNLFLHALAGLVLFGVVRRTLGSPRLSNRYESAALLLATSIAVLWVVHPAQTEAVDYLGQRAGLLVGLFFLLSLYGEIRSSDSTRPITWQIISVAAGWLGALSGVGMITLPVVILVYDYFFRDGSLSISWRRRWRFYAGLSSIWLILGAQFFLYGYGANVETRIAGRFGLNFCYPVVEYLRMTLWPHPLLIDYGDGMVQTVGSEWIYGGLLVVLFGLTLWAFWKRYPGGFLGVWFLGLAMGATSKRFGQPLAESRVYLPLAAVVTGVVLIGYRVLGRRSLLLFGAVAIGLGWLTVNRNEDYRTELRIWDQAIDQRPANPRAHLNRGRVLEGLHRGADAVAEYETALRIEPEYAAAHYALGVRFGKNPARQEDAIAHYEAVLKLKPDLAEAHVSLGNILFKQPNRLTEAITHYEAALRLKPSTPEIHCDLANAFAKLPERHQDAIVEYRSALRLNPGLPEVHCALGIALAGDKARWPEAAEEFEEALRLNPKYPAAHYNLGVLLSRTPGRTPEAVAQYEAALSLAPDYLEAHYNLGLTLTNDPARTAEAIGHFEAVLKINPEVRQAKQMIDKLRAARKG